MNDMFLTLNWTTIFENTLSGFFSGLIAGSIIVVAGFYIWKKQFLIQEKIEIYAKFIPYYIKLISYIERGYKNKLSEDYIDRTSGEILNYTAPLAHKLDIYFKGTESIFLELFDLYIKMCNGEDINMDKKQFETFISERLNKIYFLKKQLSV